MNEVKATLNFKRKKVSKLAEPLGNVEQKLSKVQGDYKVVCGALDHTVGGRDKFRSKMSQLETVVIQMPEDITTTSAKRTVLEKKIARLEAKNHKVEEKLHRALALTYDVLWMANNMELKLDCFDVEGQLRMRMLTTKDEEDRVKAEYEKRKTITLGKKAKK